MRLALGLGLALPLPLGSAEKAGRETAHDQEQRIVHALNRLTLGPRPGDVEKVRKAGLETWIDLQLHPERIPDADAERHLEPLGTQRLATTELLKKYEIPPPRGRLAGRKPLRKGDVVGYVGTSGNAPPQTPHLHFAVFKLGPEKRWGTARRSTRLRCGRRSDRQADQA